METHQEKLIGIVRYQLFGGTKPQIVENELPAILKEASQQTVYTMVFPFLRDIIIKYSPCPVFITFAALESFFAL